jgi:hypothetical protein
MGEVGSPPVWYLILESLPILRMSLPEWSEHPEKWELLNLALSYRKGKSDGETMLRNNPKYWKFCKDQSEKESRLRGK